MSQPTIEQTAFDADMEYMRGLVDRLVNAVISPSDAHDVLAGFERDGRGLIESDIDIHLDVDWPHDDASEQLAAWREGYDYLRAPVPGAPWWLPINLGAVAVEPARPRWWRRTVHKRTGRRILAALAIAALVIVGIGYATAPAKASPNPANGDGCERISWGLHFLTPQKRTICDGPRRPDGSWERWRQLWTPAHYVPFTTYCSRYSCTSSGGYHVDDQVWEEQTYVVFDSNVLDGEPGWLPAGTAVLR